MSTVAEPQPRTENPTAGFVAVKIDMLRRMRNASVDLFVQYEQHAAPVLYHRAGSSIDAKQWSTLTDSGVQHIFVRSGEFQAFGKNLLQTVQSAVEIESVPPAERFAALQIALAVEIERTAHMIDCGPYVELAGKVARDLVNLLLNNNVLPRDLFRLARHDFNTFTHVTNVTCYTVILAERMGACGSDQLELVAIGAMLHDLGKRFIPASILSKPARLTPDERAIIETHPQRGYEDLCRRPGITFEQLMMVYQHHERIDGRGYPVGITGEVIHPWSKILAVVDVFDAMTGSRPYRRPATPQDALNYIQQNAGTHFDPEVVQCWLSTITKS
jgi:HD-GYP domain-containing protein (c-di-GMP phosphodiesterase class II)